MEENKEFPHPEEEQVTPLPEVPEETPLIEELTMHSLPEEPASEEEAVLSEQNFSVEEAVVPEETAPVTEAAPMEISLPAEETVLPEEVSPVTETVSMEEISPVTETVSMEEISPVPETVSMEEISPVTETVSTEEASPAEETAPLEDPFPEEGTVLPGEGFPAEETVPMAASAKSGAEFMSRIPEVDDPQVTETIEAIEALLDKPVDQDFRYSEPDPEFDAMLKAPAPEKPRQEHERPTRKGRPKRRSREGFLGIPNILATFVWLALILAIGVTAGRMLWVCAADVLAFGREDKPVTVTIYEADTMEDIVDKLHANGLIRYKSLFHLYASISDAEEDIKPGIYDLNTRYDYHALVNFMSPKSSREVVELTIPEGYTCQQIFALLEENRVCTVVDAAAYAANGELNDYWFLEGVERGTENCLEGYLFPDTYEFYKNSTPREALQRMLNNFEIKFTEEMQGQIAALNENLTGDYTIREIVIVASLIEKESAAPSESPKVAGVIYNRLFNWGDNPKLLGIDAAIVYAQGGDAETIDTSLDSPYNTYRYPGLVPGPIANPGLASLKAALEPEMHDYFYYVLNPSSGKHQFSKTLDEHNKWIQEFYN